MRHRVFCLPSLIVLFTLFLTFSTLQAAEWKSERTIRVIPGQARNVPDEKIPVITSISVNLEGNRLVTVGDDHLARTYDLPSGDLVHVMTDQKDWVRSAKFSPDGNYLVTGGMDQGMYCYDGANFQRQFLFDTQGNTVRSVAFSRDNERVAMVGFDSKVRVYKLSDRREPITYDANGEDQRAVAFSSDGRYLAAAGRSGVVRVFDLLERKEFDLPKMHTRRINTLSFVPDDNSYVLATGGDDQKVYIWSMKDKSVLEEFTFPSGKVSAITFCGTDMIAAGGTNNAIGIWKLNTNAKKPTYYSEEHTGTIAELIWDTTNHRLISCSFDTTVKIWSVDTSVARNPGGTILR